MWPRKPFPGNAFWRNIRNWWRRSRGSKFDNLELKSTIWSRGLKDRSPRLISMVLYLGVLGALLLGKKAGVNHPITEPFLCKRDWFTWIELSTIKDGNAIQVMKESISLMKCSSGQYRHCWIITSPPYWRAVEKLARLSYSAWEVILWWITSTPFSDEGFNGPALPRDQSDQFSKEPGILPVRNNLE